MDIKHAISEAVEGICTLFSPERYPRNRKQCERKFPSLISLVFRFVIRHWYIFLPLLWLGVLIACIVEALPILGIIIVSIIATVLLAALSALVFMALMGIESIAKHIASLILYDQLDDLPENPVDSLVSYILKGDV